MSNDYSDIQISSSMPKPWEEEESFNDVLYEWMSRAPWLLISGALHFVLFLIVAAIPWSVFEKTPDQNVEASIEQPPPEELEEEEEEPEEIEEEETEEEPVIEEFEVSDHNEEDTNEEYESVEGNDSNSDSPFDSNNSNAVLGIGGGAGGKYGGRFGGSRNLRAAGGSGTEQAIKDGLEWLKNHQDDDGSWDADEFFKHDDGDQSDRTDVGDGNNDVGLTGLALLAFLGDGHTMTRGAYKDVVTKGVKWLAKEQDKETGLFGEAIGQHFLYDHAIATLAMCETYYIDKSIILKTKAQKAINYISQARNPYGAWRYAVPPDGDNDTSVTGWMIFAMKSAQEGKLKIDEEAYTAAIQFFDEMTDEGTGRVGYTERGSPSSRVPGLNQEQYPTDSGEALTAVALLCRFFLGQNPDDHSIMKDHAELLLRRLPVWEPEKFGCDMYYWYYGSYAMFQMGGRHWKEWNKALKGAVVDSRRTDGSARGSWDPAGPWGPQGGRVYATATMVLSLEVYYRYARLTGAR